MEDDRYRHWRNKADPGAGKEAARRRPGKAWKYQKRISVDVPYAGSEKNLIKGRIFNGIVLYRSWPDADLFL